APAWLVLRSCCCSTSRLRASTRAAVWSSGPQFAISFPTGPTSFSPPSTWRRLTSWRGAWCIDHGRAIAAGTPAELKGRVGRDVLEVRPRVAADFPAVEEGLGLVTP